MIDRLRIRSGEIRVRIFNLTIVPTDSLPISIENANDRYRLPYSAGKEVDLATFIPDHRDDYFFTNRSSASFVLR
jgi:hypothetical protein